MEVYNAEIFNMQPLLSGGRRWQPRAVSWCPWQGQGQLLHSLGEGARLGFSRDSAGGEAVTEPHCSGAAFSGCVLLREPDTQQELHPE